jgi:hypothetical protein
VELGKSTVVGRTAFQGVAAPVGVANYLRCDQPVSSDHVLTLDPGPRHLKIVEALFAATGVAANLTTDTHLAALAIEYQCELHSNEADFGRFPGLRWRKSPRVTWRPTPGAFRDARTPRTLAGWTIPIPPVRVEMVSRPAPRPRRPRDLARVSDDALLARQGRRHSAAAALLDQA